MVEEWTSLFLMLVLANPVNACSFVQMDISSFTNLEIVQPTMTYQDRGQVGCMVECGRSESCISAIWNKQYQECRVVVEYLHPDDDISNTHTFLTDQSELFVKKEFTNTDQGKIYMYTIHRVI